MLAKRSVGVAGGGDEFVDLGVAIHVAAVERQRVALGPDRSRKGPSVDDAIEVVDFGSLIEKATVVGVDIESLVQIRFCGDFDLPSEMVRSRLTAKEVFTIDREDGGFGLEILRDPGRFVCAI